MPGRSKRASLRLLVAMCVIGCTRFICAAEFSVRLEGQCPQHSTTLVARRIDLKAPPLERLVAVPSSITIPLGDGMWEVGVRGEDTWSAPAYVNDNGKATLRVWRTNRVVGR